MPEIKYPTVEKIIEYNILVLNLIKVKKADKPEVINRNVLYPIINGCKNLDGDIYNKAVFLLKGIIQKHPFASGNRRTAFITTKDFILSNKGRFKIKDDPDYAKAMQGIRENFYKDSDIKEWILTGEIHEFKR